MGSTRIWTSSSPIPISFTLDTPSMSCNSSFKSKIKSFNSTKFPSKANSIMGSSLEVISCISGFPFKLKGKLVILFILLSISLCNLIKLSLEIFSSATIFTMDSPSLEMEVISWIFSNSLIAFSIGTVRFISTSSADAPG